MNDTLEAISVQRLNRAVKSVVHAVPGSLSSVDSESGQLDASAKSSLTTPVVSSVAGSVIGMQPPQSFMLSLDMAGLPVVPGHSAPDRTIIPGFPLPDMQNFSALKPKRLAPYTGPMSLSQIISGDHTLPRLQPMPPHVLAPAVPSLSAVPPYHPSTAVLASSVPISNLPSLPHPTVRFPQQPPPHSAPSQLQVLGNLPSSSYVTCFLPPPVVPPSSSKAPAMTLSHTSHLQLLVPQHMNGLPPSGPLSPATTQLLQSAIEAESIDSGLPAYHDSETLAPMSSLLSMISHNADDMHRLLTSQAGAMPSQSMSHDTDSGLHADFGDNHLLDTAEGTVMQCLQEDTSISPSQGEIDALPSPPLQPHATSPDASPGNPNSAQEVDVVDIVEDGDEAEATASSLLGGDTVGNVTSLNALVDTENNVPSPATTSLQTLAPPDGTQENQPALTAVFDFVLQPKSVKVTRPCEVDQNRIMRAANVPAYPALDGAPTNKGRYCVDCNKMYRGDDGCTTHSISYAIISDSPIPSRARRSIPSQLTLRAINNQTAPNFMGVIVLESIASHTLFGPLLGKKTTKELLERPTETAYVWELFDDGRQSQVLDCRNEEKSNWLMFVKRARTTAEQNVMVYQQQDDIYFVTCKDIRPGTELLYWYARDYAKMLGVAWRPEDFFKCPTCSKQFPDVNSVKQHVRYAHPDMTRRNCKCQLCGHAFTCASKLKTHMLSHMGVKPHKCQYCGKQFTDGSNLRMHLRLHTGERKFACKLCKRTFRQKAHLDMHQLTHTGEKRLQCLFCERMFARASEVKQHEYMHTREKLFQCTHENCSKVFWKLQNYKRHLKVHMGVREFTCAKCQKSFATSFHMKRHMGVCKGPKSDTRKELNAQTGAELGLSIAKRRIQKRHSVNFKETETTWECPL